MGMLSHANTRDANEQPIIDALLAAGCSVDRIDTPCDLIVGHFDENGEGVTTLMEVKLPLGPQGGDSHSRLTPNEMEFAGRHKGRYAVVRSPEDALRAVVKMPSAIFSKGCR